MAKSLQEQQTEYWYGWEQRGRGWLVYTHPVQLEPPLDAFVPQSGRQQSHIDDGRVETVVSLVKKGIGSLFKKEEKQEPVIEKPTGYPDNPIAFETDSPLCVFRVSLPKKHDVDAVQAEKLLHMLAFSGAPFSFEIIGVQNLIVIQWTCRAEDQDRLTSQLRAYFPALAIQTVEPYVLPFDDTQPLAIGDMGLENEFMLPLATVSKFSPDPLIGIMAALENLSYGESGMVQILFQGTNYPWTEAIQYISSDGEKGSFFADMPQLPKLAQEKASSHLYGVVVRVIGQGGNKARSGAIIYNLANSIISTTQSQHNNLMLLSNGGYPYEKHLESVYERTSHRLGMILNSEELVSLVHMPSSSVATSKLSRQMVKTKPLPAALKDGRYGIGFNTHMGQEEIAWITDAQRLKHTHIIGSTGTGKSEFLKNLALQDSDAGNGFVVFDPHGDLIDDIISRLPTERLQDVILIDPSDMEFPIGFNLLEANTELEKIILSSDLVETFRRQSTAWGDSMTSILTNAINAFLECPSGGTLLELRKFLLDAKYRVKILSTIDDPVIVSYWQHDFLELRKGSLAPLLTRLDTFLRPKIVRNMMAQKEGLDFKKALAENKIVLVKLSQGLIGEENSYLLGTLLLAKVYQAAQSRQSVTKSERTPYYVYVDEFQHFITPTLEDILSGARKYGLGLILAHQELKQIEDTRVGNSVISNPAIRLCFRLGDNDAKKLEQGFSTFDANDLQNLGVGEAIVRVERSDWDFNIYTGEPSNEDVVEGNFDIVREQTRLLYATPVEEVEAIVHELYQIEVVQLKAKEPKPDKAPIESTPELTKEPEKTVTEALPFEAQEPVEDIEAAAKKFIESTEKQKQKREHLYMQEFVKKMAEQRGFKVQLEAPVAKGGRIDILLTRNDLTIACELSVTNTVEYEVGNIQKCLDASYSHVVMLCSNETHLRNIKQAASATINTETIQFLNPEQLSVYLDTFIMKDTKRETRIKGYRVKTSYGPKDINS